LHCNETMEIMILENKKIAIIGGGPVGLMAATLLRQKGVDVTVYERDKDPQARIWGGTLDLHESSGQEAMKKAGLLESYYAMAIPMGRTITDLTGKVFFIKTPEYDSPEINRNDLKRLLLGSFKSESVVWESKFTGIEQQDAHWLLHFENQPDAIADFVIGANGGMSNLRKYIMDTEVAYTGTFIIQGEVHQAELKCPEFHQLCASNILMTAAEGITFVANPKNNDALTYGVSFRMDEESFQKLGLDFHDTNNITTFLSNMFRRWDQRYKQLFRATSFFVGLPARKLPLGKQWKSNRPLPITLIGDAAHLMPPFAGQGVNTGLKDALILSDNLTNGNFETIAAAISDYEQQMFVYAKEAQLETSENEIVMHAPDFSFAKRFNA
jgi:2-polyprenyl-6-methoxyphenol hydroxylase-like FAD-dependent oxidoreductase